MSTADRVVTISDWIRQRAMQGLPTAPPAVSAPIDPAHPWGPTAHTFGGFISTPAPSSPRPRGTAWPEEL